MPRAPGRVVFINRYFHPDESATSQILTDLAVHLAEQHKVMVLTSRHRGGSETLLPAQGQLGPVTIRRIWSLQERRGSLLSRVLAFVSFYPGALLALLRILRPGDVVIAKTDPPLIACIAALAAGLRGATLITWLQDLYPEVAMRLGTPFVDGSLGRWLTRLRNRALRTAHRNVVIGELMAEQLHAEGISRDRIAVIPNWADEQAIRPKPAAESATRRAWGLTADAFVLGYSGNLGKAHESATIVAAAELLRDRADIRLLFVGGGHEFRRLQAQVESLGLTSFLFRPHQPREALADSLAAADAHWLSLRPELEGLIVPSKFYGILAAGRPVVAVTARYGEVARSVTAHQCGFAIEPGDARGLADAIIALASTPELREAMGIRSRGLAETQFAKHAALDRWSSVVAVGQSAAARLRDRS